MNARPLHGVFANAQRFDEGKLIERKRFGFVQVRDGDGDSFAHSAVDVDAEALQGFAAVRPTGSARPAIPTIQVRFDGATIARLESVRSLWNRNDLDAEFVAEDARVFEERLSPGKGVKIGATNPHSTHVNESMTQ